MSGKSTQKKNTTKARKSKDSKVRKRIFCVLSIAAICVAFLFNYKAMFDRKLDVNGDNISYFLLAKALSDGEGYVNLASPTAPTHTHFPPGYPMFMSVFMRIFPDNIVAMKILNGVLFFLALLMLFRIIRKTTGDNIWLALTACLVAVFHPDLLRWSVIMMSEMLYIVISFGIILICLDLDVGSIFTKGPKDKRQVARLILLCLLVMSAYLVRTMGISVVLAAALAFGVTALKALAGKSRTWWKPALAAVAISVSLVLVHEGWSLRNQRVAPGFHSDYSTGFMYTFSQERMTPTLWKDRIISNFAEFTTQWIPDSMLRPADTGDHTDHRKPTAAGWVKGLVLISLMCFGISKLKKGRVLILSYILITFSVLMLYQEQYAGVRYFIPVLPLMLFVLLNGIWWIFLLLTGLVSRKARVVVPVLAVLAVAAFLYKPFMDGQKPLRARAKYKTYLEMKNLNPDFAHYLQAAEWIKEHTGKEVVIACRKPEMMYMYTGYRHSVMFPLRGDEQKVLDFFKDSGVNCVVVDTWAHHAYSVIFPVMANHKDAFPVYYQSSKDDSPAETLIAAFLPSKLSLETADDQ